MDQHEDDSGFSEIVETGYGMAGGAIGALIGGTVGGPPGAVLGSSIAPAASAALRRVAVEIKGRFLSRKEEERIASAIYHAARRIEQRTEEGEQPRSDDFFDNTSDRSAGEEILEGGLIAAQREHEERKVAFVGYLLSSICFDSGVDRAKANLMIDVAERMSFRQMMLLSLLNRLEEFGIQTENRRVVDLTSVDSIYWMPFDLVYETRDLKQLGIVDYSGTLSETHYDLLSLSLTRIGTKLYSLMELSRIESDDLEPLAHLCKSRRYDS